MKRYVLVFAVIALAIFTVEKWGNSDLFVCPRNYANIDELLNSNNPWFKSLIEKNPNITPEEAGKAWSEELAKHHCR